MSDDCKVRLKTEKTEINFPTRSSSLGKNVIETKTLGDHGFYSFDPGFYSTASCESKITFIDGEKGILLYRGYAIDDLAFHGDYMDVCHALIYGDLPNVTEKTQFIHKIKKNLDVHQKLKHFFLGFRRDAHPMAIMVGVVGALSAFYHDALDISRPEHREYSAYRLIAKMPTIAAMCYKHSVNQTFIHPTSSFTYAENFLHMMFGTPHEESQPHPVLARAVDRIFTLHADHEQNASTTTVRIAGSTGTNPFACIASGIAALWGPAHGGANEACLNMLHKIGNESNIGAYIEKAKNKNDPFRLMGFGHRVYKNYDPRAKVMQKTCHEVLEITGSRNNPIFKLAMKLEKIALEDEYFIKKKLYPNVDFYSGITLSALGIPINMFTVIFSLSRTVGWISHWMEMMGDSDHTLARPRQLYTGQIQRKFVPLDKRL